MLQGCPMKRRQIRVVFPCTYIIPSCSLETQTWVFGSPGFDLFNLDRLWFAYLLTSRYWQLWPPVSLQKLSGMPEGTLTRNIQTHLQSCGQLASKLLIASLILLLPLALWWLLFCKKGGVKVVYFKASSFLLLTFAYRGVSAVESSTSGRSGGKTKQLSLV